MEKKYTIHVPSEQYGYVEAHIDTLIEAKTEYDNIKKIFAGEKVEGMSTLEFSKFCQKVLTENVYNNDDLDKLSPLQQWWLKITSNAIIRVKSKNENN